MMHIYNVKATLRDTFYGEPCVLYGTRSKDAQALASMASATVRTRALDGHKYWYFFLKDIKNRDLVRFLMRRNGLRPQFHMSHYYAEPLPAFRVRMSGLEQCPDLMDFTRLISKESSEEGKTSPDMERYLDTIKTKLSMSRAKQK